MPDNLHCLESWTSCILVSGRGSSMSRVKSSSVSSLFSLFLEFPGPPGVLVLNLLNSIKRSDDYQNISEMKNIDYLPLIPPKIQVRDWDLILALIHLYTVPLSLLFLRGRGRRWGGRPLPLAFLVSFLSFVTLLVGNKLQHQKCISTNTAIICQNHLLLFPP